MKDNFNLYLFPREILTEELYNLLRELHGGSFGGDYKNVYTLELVPGAEHFISVNSGNTWSYRNRLIVTKEQVDKFIQINNVVPMKFVEFIDSYED